MGQQNTKKLSDRSFVRLALTLIIGVLFCIICLSATTYAWFAVSIKGDNNKIQTSDVCLISVSIYKDGTEEATVDTQNPITIQCEGTYVVSLTLPKESASGYLVLTVGEDKYYSDYIQRNENNDQTLTFTLNVKTSTSVTFTARWGIYSNETGIKNDETLTIG